MPNNYPDTFYYTETQSRETFTDQPSGALNVNQLVQGEPAWVAQGTKEKKPKKLIFADWSCRNWDRNKKLPIIENLKQLQSKGFQLYYVDKSGQIKLMDIYEYINNRYVKLDYPEEIAKAAIIQHHLSRQEVLVLDYYLHPIVHDKQIDPDMPYLLISDFLSLNEKEQLKFIEITKQSNPPLKKIFYNHFPFKEAQVLKTLTSHFPNASVAPRYQNITLTSNELTSLLDKGSLTIDGITLTLDLLAEVTKLQLTGSGITWVQLEKLLKATPKLQLLKLPEKSNLVGVKQFAANELTELHLLESNINAKDFSTLIQASSNLNSLTINNCPHLREAFETAHFNKLAVARFENCNLQDDDLKLIANSMPNLGELVLTNYQNPKGSINKFDKELVALWKCSMLNSSISATSLTTLLSATPNIMILLLANCTNLSNPFELTRPLDRLEDLYLITSNITCKGIVAFMKAAPKLKKMDISYCKNLQDDIGELGLKWDNLVVISFENSNITNSNMKSILQATPKLKKLNIIGCNLQNIVDITKNLKELEELNLSSKGTTYKEIQELIKNLPNLRILDFDEKIPLTAEEIKTLRQIRPHLMITDLQDTRRPDKDDKWPDLPVDSVYTFVDPVHDPETYKTLKPTSEEDFVFKFKGINKTKNQGMIIEKFCQYCTLKQVHLAIIPKLQDGICKVLSHFAWDCEKMESDLAALLIEKIAQWNGAKNTLTPELESIFELLWKYIAEDQRHNFRTTKVNYLGDRDNLIPLLNTIPQDGYVLENAWHAIFIKKNLSDGSWLFYDPNFISGPKKVNEHELLKLIKQSLGSQLMISSNQANWVPVIQNPQKFIAEGGLLVLNQADNREAILKQLAKVTDYTTQSLEGLLLRGTSGTPAWVRCLEKPELKPLTYSLLTQFMQKNPKTGAETLQKSIELITPWQKQECITHLLSITPGNKELTNALIAILRNAPEVLLYEKQLQTWSSPSNAVPSLLEYCQRCMQPEGAKKRLIKLGSSSQIDSLHWALEDYAKKTKKPVFYVNSPRDLVCSAPFIQRDKTNPDLGQLQKGPGGPLFEFLKAHQTGEPPIIIVNYQGFSDEDLVRFNALLDKERRADGAKVPEQALIIGLINTNKPDCYQGSDFYSRFDQTETCPVPEQALAQALPQLPLLQQTIDKPIKTSPINLFQAANWKELLLGRWTLEGDKLFFKEGLLVPALKKNLPLEIQNGFWDIPEFENFWRTALQKGVIEHAGRTIEIPPNLQLFRSEGYPWQTLKSSFTLTEHPKDQMAKALNPQCINTFFSHDAYQKDKGLAPTQGLIEAAKNTALKVVLTHPLTHDQWARILIECQDHHVNLQVECAPGVTLPKDLIAAHVAVKPQATPWTNTTPLAETTLITSSDVDTTLAMLTKQNKKEWQIIDVSECTASDLLEHLDGSFNAQSLKFKFSETLSVLRQALKDKTPLILKGRFSAELEQRLAPLLLDRQRQASLSPLVLISDTTTSFQFLSTHTHQVSVAEKEQCLNLTAGSELHKKLQPFLANSALSMLKAFAEAFLQNKNNSSWDGILKAPAVSALKKLDPATSKEEAEAFHQQRITAVSQVLKKSPYVFLAGLSGVGKSTFVTQYLGISPHTLCTLDQDCPKQKRNAILKQWATTKNPAGLNLLFVDEATLSPSDWSLFEGLYNIPPGILVDGEWLPLTENHKVVFAGNPVSYGDERRLATLFERHGNSLVFEPLPTAVLYEHLLKPAFTKTKLESSTEALSQHFIEVYRFLVACSTTDVLIAPRELQMMVLLTLSHCQDHPQAKPEDVAHHYAYLLAKNLVPEHKKAEFDQQFKPKNNWASPLSLKQTDFLLTPSRQPIAHQLDDLLALRQMRRSATNPIHQYGGLGGLILDGEPGVGKSELVLALLRHRGYEEVHQFDGPPNIQGPDKPFYRMPVSMQLDDKIKLLLKAFHEGAVVMVDEINASPMMERLMNSLLMGFTPDGKRPQKPGFLVIGTQNPVTMAGRRAPSTALSRRLITSLLLAYPGEEMKNILLHKTMTEAQATAMIAAYNKNVKYALNNHLSPLPTFRNLLNLAENVMKAQEKSAIEQINQAIKDVNAVAVDFTHDTIETLDSHEMVLLQQINILAQLDNLTGTEPPILITTLKQAVASRQEQIKLQSNILRVELEKVYPAKVLAQINAIQIDFSEATTAETVNTHAKQLLAQLKTINDNMDAVLKNKPQQIVEPLKNSLLQKQQLVIGKQKGRLLIIEKEEDDEIEALKMPNTKDKFKHIVKHWIGGTLLFSDKEGLSFVRKFAIKTILNPASRTQENIAALPKFKELLKQNPEYIQAYADIYLNNETVQLDELIKLHELKDVQGNPVYQKQELINAMALMAKNELETKTIYLALIELGARKAANQYLNSPQIEQLCMADNKDDFIRVAENIARKVHSPGTTPKNLIDKLSIQTFLHTASKTSKNSDALPKFIELLSKNHEYTEAYADIFLNNQKVKLDGLIKLHELKDAMGNKIFEVDDLAKAMGLMAKKGWQAGNNYLALIEIGANTQANQYLYLRENPELQLNEYLLKCNILIAEIEKLSWGIADPVHDYSHEMKKLLTDNKDDFFVLSFHLQVLQHYKNRMDTPDNRERRQFAQYIQEIKKQSSSKMDTYTETFCQQMQDILDKGNQEFKDFLPQLTQVKEAVCSPQMKAVHEELQRLEIDSHTFFTKGGHAKKIKDIKQAIAQVPLLERMHIFTNQSNPLCNEVRKSLAATRVSLINPIGKNGNVISKNAATSFKNIEKKFPTVDEAKEAPQIEPREPGTFRDGSG